MLIGSTRSVFRFIGFLKNKLHPKLEAIKLRIEVNWISGYRLGLQLNPDNPIDQIQVRVNRIWLFGFGGTILFGLPDLELYYSVQVIGWKKIRFGSTRNANRIQIGYPV